MGTVLGDLLFEIFSIDDENEQKRMIKKKIFIPNIVGGTILVIIGVALFFPDFISKETFSSHLFIFGIELILLAFLVWIKDYKNFKMKKSYRFFYFYSYYSFTIFLAHNLLIFLFGRQFNALQIWIVIIPIVILWTALFYLIYKKIRNKASIKVLVSEIASYLSKKIELPDIFVKL